MSDQLKLQPIRGWQPGCFTKWTRAGFLLSPTYHRYGQALTTLEWRARNGWEGAAGGARKHHGGQSTVATSLAAWYSRLNRLGRAIAHHRGYLSVLSRSKPGGRSGTSGPGHVICRQERHCDHHDMSRCSLFSRLFSAHNAFQNARIYFMRASLSFARFLSC